MTKISLLAAVALTVLTSLAAPANAAPLVEKKITQFGLEPRLSGCSKWAYPWPGAKICIAPGVEYLQHEFTLVVDGPPADEVVRGVLGEAAAAAVAAAVGVGLGTPSPEPTSRIAAALAAAKTAFVGYLAARGFERIINSYQLRIDHNTFWS